MQTSTLKKKPTLNKSHRQIDYRPFVKPAIAALVGFSFSQLDALGDLSPFSIAFVSSVSFDYCFAAFIGACLGSFVSRQWQTALRCVLSLLTASLFRLVVLRKTKSADNRTACAVTAFCSCLCSSCAYIALTEFSVTYAVSAAAEAVICLFSVFIFMRSFKIPVFSIGIKNLAAQDSACITYTVCTFLMSLSGLTFGSVSPARIIAAAAIIFTAQYKGAFAASAVGICAGAALCIPEDLRFMFPLYALSALVSGIFASFGTYTCALSFSLTACIIAIIHGIDDFSFFPYVEAIIASTAYAIIPPKWTNLLQDKLNERSFYKDEHIERQVCRNLRNAAEKVGEVSDIVSRVSEKLDKVINPEINKVFAKMQQNVCYGCGKKSECWNKFFSETAHDIMVISGIQQGNGLKTALERRCIRPNALMREINKYYGEFVSGIASKTKITEMRNIVSDQFSVVSQFLFEIAENAKETRIEDRSRSRSILTFLRDASLDFDSLHFFTNPNSAVSVELASENDPNEIDINKTKKLLELSTGKLFDLPEIDITETGTLLSLSERPSYSMLFGHAQIPIAKSKICGDCVGRASDKSGNEIALISDGMGTGSRAAIDATMTATLMEKLLSCGFSFESSVKMVNSALIVKSTDETLATVDAVSINTYTAEADFHKAGATISFIRHKDTVRIVKQPSMPIGIIRNIVPAHIREKLYVGDIIMLVSDGVTSGDCGWINDELLAWSTNNMDDLAKHIASMTHLRLDENTADDITVVTAKVMKNR